MITINVVAVLILAFVPLTIAIFLLICGIHSAINDKDWFFCIAMVICFMFFSFLSGITFLRCYDEYRNAMPQNKVKILRQKISDAEKELQKFLIDYPELNENE